MRTQDHSPVCVQIGTRAAKETVIAGGFWPRKRSQNDNPGLPVAFSCLLGILLLLCPGFTRAQQSTESRLDYAVTLADAAHHRVHVSMTYNPKNGGNEVQLPVWNATYQVRDFARHIIAIKASGPPGEAIALRQLDKTTWELHPQGEWVTVTYDIVLDEAGPFGAQFNAHHAFLNLAELLLYPVAGRDLPITLRFEQVPPNWKLATPLQSIRRLEFSSSVVSSDIILRAPNYDRLVDSPCELGEFAESDFEQGGAKYRVVIDANPADYDASKLVEALKKITATETAWMNDRPFDSYLFIYHFLRGFAGGGMEHVDSTAIDHSASDLKDLRGLESTSAHEFFHLWNVKRIRPQSLEPIDYSRENYTRALWFSEGVTSTVADLTLLKAGLMNSAEFFQHISEGITVLQSRSAHLNQSAEESSLDAWLEKYPNYRAPERSVSYYNKGELLGILLDLQIRQDSYGRYSLRDLFRAMNRNYAKQGKFFPDSEGVREEAEKLTGTDLRSFFTQYVAGVQELPYEKLFGTVGLMLEPQVRTIADPGFSATRNFGGPLIIDEVYGDQARGAGLHEGDEIMAIDGEQSGRNFERRFADLKPGTKVRVNVFSQGRHKEVEITLNGRSVSAYVLSESPQATQEQLARRASWLRSEDQNSVATK